VIQGPFSGGLVVEGKVLVVGDYELPRGNSLIFVGTDSQLNVTGKATLRDGVIIYLSDDEIKELKPLGLLRQTMTYLIAGVKQTQLGSAGGKTTLLAAHSRRACLRPSTIASGDSVTYTTSLRYVNGCNSWWIILLCVSPSIVGFLLAIIIPLCA
jgi:hypothetical protein